MEQMTVARLVGQSIALSGKSQRIIAAECGYANPNMITMIKKGRTKLPLNKIAALASALIVDPGYLLRLAMGEYEAEAWAVIVQTLGKAVSITDDELRLIELVRGVGFGRTPCLDLGENAVELSAAIQRAVARDDARDLAAVSRFDAVPSNARSTR